MKVKFTPSAKVTFLEQLAYIKKDNPAAALLLRQKCEERLKRLQDFPDSGRIIPEFPELPFREVVVGPYRFFYRVKDQTVWIVAVWHQAQEKQQPPEQSK